MAAWVRFRLQTAAVLRSKDHSVGLISPAWRCRAVAMRKLQVSLLSSNKPASWWVQSLGDLGGSIPTFCRWTPHFWSPGRSTKKKSRKGWRAWLCVVWPLQTFWKMPFKIWLPKLVMRMSMSSPGRSEGSRSEVSPQVDLMSCGDGSKPMNIIKLPYGFVWK